MGGHIDPVRRRRRRRPVRGRYQRQEDQHSTGGIVGELRVKEGDRVSQGDLLVRLDETVTRANMQVVQAARRVYRPPGSREAERDGLSEVDAGGVRQPSQRAGRSEDHVLGADAVHRTRRASRDAQKDQLKKRIAQSQDEIVGLRAQQRRKPARPS